MEEKEGEERQKFFHQYGSEMAKVAISLPQEAITPLEHTRSSSSDQHQRLVPSFPQKTEFAARTRHSKGEKQ